MNITKSASILDWRTNTQGRWTAVVDDIAPSTQDISFGNGYTATVTNRKITVENPTRPSGTVTYAVEDVANTAYAGNLAAVGSVKDTLDVVTGERNMKLGVMTINGTEHWTLSGQGIPAFYIRYETLGVPVWKKVSGGCMAICDKVLRVTRVDMQNDVTGFCVGDTTSGNENNLVFRVHGITDVDSFKHWLSENNPVIYYELAEPTSSETTPQPLSLETGSNTASMTDTSTGDKPVFPVSYDGTDYAIATKSSRVYLKDVNGTVERVTGVTSIPVRGGRDNVMDLTRMFGSSLEPGTLDAFYSLFPAWRGYKLPYNPGSLLNFKGTGLKSVGFNQWDGTYGNTNTYLKADGTMGPGSLYGISKYIRAIPGQTYRLQTYTFGAICWYTYDKTYISGAGYYGNNTWKEESFTAPANAYWLRFTIYVPRENETCLYFQWSGTRNGDYEPYWDYTRPVPTLTYFPDGMNGRGNVYDEINDRQAIRRFGKVDLGTLVWNWATSDGGLWYTDSITSTVKRPASNSVAALVMSSNYDAIATSSINGNSNNLNTIAISAINGRLWANNGSTTVSPSGWLVYELATPIVTTFSEEISTTARISDYGTEECLPVNGYDPVTAPFRGIVLYQDDYARTITKLPENYQSQDSMDNLLALLGQLHNGTITATFDSANQVYTYQFTPNA